MRIITLHSEEQFINRLRNHTRASLTKHCLHFWGRYFTHKSFALLPQLITKWIGSEGEIYICHDRDIFVVSWALRENGYEKLRLNLRNIFPHEYKITQVLSFYNLHQNALMLIELIEAKHAKCIAEQETIEKKRLKEQKTQMREAFFQTIPEEALLQTLNTRRKDRPHLEILNIKYDEFSRRLISTALTGFSLVFAENGKTAIQQYLYTAPDIVFLDISLPDASDQGVLSKIIKFDPKAYIVLLSGNSPSENVITAVKYGARGFVGKPFTKEKLFQYINKCPKAEFKTPGD